MPLSAVILFAEEDRAVAEAVRSHLAKNEVEARLAAGIEDVRQARAAVAVVSAAASEILPLIEEALRLRIPILVLRLNQAALPTKLRKALDGLTDLVFDAFSPLAFLSLQPLARKILGFLTPAGPGRPTRGGTLREIEEVDRDWGVTYRGEPREEAEEPPGAYSVREWPLEGASGADPEREPPSIAHPATPPPEIRKDNVHFSAYAPPAVTPGAEFILSIWAFLEQDREKVEERATKGGHGEAGFEGPIRIARGTELTVCLDLPGFEVDPPGTLAWVGEIGNCSFGVKAPEDLAARRYLGTAKLLLAGVQVGRLRFAIEVGAQVSPAKELPATYERVRTLFASYSSKDRIEVLRFCQGAEAVGVEAFVDVLSLRSGEDWEKRLTKEVVSRDLFCLFWSASARRSKWVKKEWQAAVKARGIDYIHPVPLADPRDVPPPPELGGNKHFNDLSQIVIAYEKLRKGEAGPS